MTNIHRLLQVLEASPHQAVLATIIRVEGSAYRKAGAAMLLFEDGTSYGLLSAGCLEADLSIRAKDLKNKNQTQVLTYDLQAEDDLGWGAGVGCNGVIHVLLEPIQGSLREDLQKVKQFLDQGIPVVRVKALSSNGTVRESIYWADHERSVGFWEREIPDELLQKVRGVRGAALLSNSNRSETDFFFFQQYLPIPRLILFGAGPDAAPLATFASQTGFAVTVADWRPASCTRVHFPHVDALVLGRPHELIKQIQFNPRDSVVLMTHHFQHDKELLHLLIQQKLAYLGVLGPRERTARLLEGAEVPSWVHAPVGIAIGAEGPEEIAISILAEIIQTNRKGDAP